MWISGKGITRYFLFASERSFTSINQSKLYVARGVELVQLGCRSKARFRRSRRARDVVERLGVRPTLARL